jgi:cytochrome c biogenesis protein CcmG, thiol:disulfide interchange protein DsbE
MTTKAQRSRGMPRRSTDARTASGGSSRTPLLVFGGIAALAVVAIVAALLLSSPSSSEPSSEPVQVSGTALPAMVASGNDPAIGIELPTLSGVGLDGEPLMIGPDDGPLAIVILAHWCPHCQAELPRIVDWLAANEVPDGVRIVALSTSIDPARPNYPPSAWLEREGWTQPTLVDDANSTALQALGVASFPGFVTVGADGTVQQRLTGELGGDQFGALLESIAP